MTEEQVENLKRLYPIVEITFEKALANKLEKIVERKAIRRNEFNDLWDRALPRINAYLDLERTFND